jgi:hypothetical protein
MKFAARTGYRVGLRSDGTAVAAGDDQPRHANHV